LSRGIGLHRELDFVKKDGKKIHVLINTSPLLDNKQRYMGAVSAITDITERKLMEERLRSEKEKLELVTSNINIGVALIAKDYKVVWANRVLNDLFGDIEGSYSYLTYGKSEGNLVKHGAEKVFAGAPSNRCEQCTTDKKGEPFWSEIITTPIKNNRGDPVLALQIVIPIGERKKMEQALCDSEKKYRELVEKANSIIFKWDLNGKILYFNEYAEKFFGFSRDEIIGKSVYEAILPLKDSMGNDLSELLSKIISDENFAEHLNENITKSGERVWVHWTNQPIKDESGNIVAILSVGSNITKRIVESDKSNSRQQAAGLA
jgi:PAS domain S-box-containing protein